MDDVVVRAWYSQEDKNQWFTLFSEGFEQLNEKNGIENTGWRTKSEQVFESNQIEPGLNHLSIQPAEDEQITVVKLFNIPVDFPFDVSDKTFEIRYNEDMYSESAAYDDAFPGHGGHGPSLPNFYSSSSNTLSNSTPGRSRISELFNTYYIYTFDGKLLAEYDHNGSCIRDYIYFGNRLIAEYKPQTNEYFYYMTDQINYTRIIVNDNGDVVFSEAYGPYGDIQKTWTNTYNPKLKFSGKEREGYSDLDYFGARYYDHKSLRFNSVDPIINREEALYNPQLWNLYAYCRNNPITYFDPDGRSEAAVIEAGKTLTPLIPLIASGGPYAAVGAAIITGVIIGIKAHEAGYPAKTAREYESELMRSGYDALFGSKKDNVVLSKGGKKATDSSKGMPHGDGGRALTKAEKQIQGLEEQLKTSKGKEKTRIKQKIKNIREAAQKAQKGKTHHRK